ncbi:MAG: hypothetical protein SVX43_12360, partial [Cyanobacteriota bacterium]|nr:hypothetical protein [Cyanobacteriota bacterium]
MRKRLNSIKLLGILALLAIALPSTLLAQTPENPAQPAFQLEQQAVQQREGGQLAAAADLYRQAIARYRELGETDNADAAVLELAKTILLMKDYPQAIAMF